MANTPAFVQPSPLERLFNRLFGFLVSWGIGPFYAYLLQVQGRKSARIYSTPVSVLDYKGKRWLVAPRGETQWVRNARVSGQVWLKRGRSRQRYVVRAVDDRDKPEILREYLNRYRVAVQRYFSVPVDAPLEAFSHIAWQYPVFELIAQ
jgi:deazaflavin-dependent oxidoreductase (nitroreductase family)